jgi:hypothetical protein
VAIFELGMAVSRLIVLVLWMLMDVCQWILVCSFAFLLTTQILCCEEGMERHGRVRTAVGDFGAQLKSSSNVGDLFENLAS